MNSGDSESTTIYRGERKMLCRHKFQEHVMRTNSAQTAMGGKIWKETLANRSEQSWNGNHTKRTTSLLVQAPAQANTKWNSHIWTWMWRI